MQYRKLGKTGIDVSILGFGAMRLPSDENEAIMTIRRSFELGVNYIDTAYSYTGSEEIAGKAIKGWRNRIHVATKLPLWLVESREDYRRFLELQLKRLDMDHVDFYYFHGLDDERWDKKVVRFDLLEEARKAKEEGLILHSSFSFHGHPDVMKKLVDTGEFETVLCQYNIIDRSNEDAISYADSRGMGVIAMGPLAGGWLAGPAGGSEAGAGAGIGAASLADDPVPMAETALKFVLRNTSIHCAISGMGSVDMVEKNAAVASQVDPSSNADMEKIEAILLKLKRLSELYCTGCDYCMPCPSGIKISTVFKIFNYYRLFGAIDLARREYGYFGRDERFGPSPADCTECGACETKCPQKIAIREQLKMVVKELS